MVNKELTTEEWKEEKKKRNHKWLQCRCCTDQDTGEKYGWGRVLDYIGVA